MDKREKFTSKLGFVMACIGSAIGLWKYMDVSIPAWRLRWGGIFDPILFCLS